MMLTRLSHVWGLQDAIIEQTNKDDGKDDQSCTSVRELQTRVKYWEKEEPASIRCGCQSSLQPPGSVEWGRLLTATPLRGPNGDQERICFSVLVLKSWRKAVWRGRHIQERYLWGAWERFAGTLKLWGELQETAAGGGEKVQKQKIKASGGDGGDHRGGPQAGDTISSRNWAFWTGWWSVFKRIQTRISLLKSAPQIPEQDCLKNNNNNKICIFEFCSVT